MFYAHDGSEVAMDSFSIHVTDGLFNESRRLSVIIGMVNDETPRVIVNRGLRIHSGKLGFRAGGCCMANDGTPQLLSMGEI